MPETFKVRIYTCKKHPSWMLEDRTPVMAASLKVFCPLCKDEWMARAIGVADCRTETRKREAE